MTNKCTCELLIKLGIPESAIKHTKKCKIQKEKKDSMRNTEKIRKRLKL